MPSVADTSPSTKLQGRSLIRAPGRLARCVLGWLTGTRQLRWVAATFMLLLTISALAVLSGIAFTPTQSVDTLGQHFTIRAASPSMSWSGHGEITVNTGHPQTFYLLPTEYYGPLRVHLSVDAPFQGSDLLNKVAIDHKLPPEVANDFERGFKVWLLWFALVTLGTGLLLGAVAALIVLLIKHRTRQALMLWLRSFLVNVVAVLAVGALFVMGSASIAEATSLDSLVGHTALHLSPIPEGPKLTGYDAVSIGDSRAATQGGKAITNATKEDKDCQRSSDSLGAQVGRLQGWRVLNLACSAATINEGLMGEQSRGGRMLAPQISRVKQMTNLRVVFVTIGPNDLWWSRAIGLCYLAPVCDDNLTTPDYQALLEKFKWDYHDLLVELQDLTNGPGGTHPKVVINGSYTLVNNGESCAATTGLSADKIAMLNARNADLNQALQTGAGLFGFVYVQPKLLTLCDKLDTAPGPDIRGPKDNDAFHPTSQGVAHMALDDVLAMAGLPDNTAAAPTSK